jgi:hypothetical protein
MEMTMNRIWIELEMPWSEGKPRRIDHALGKRRAELADRAMRKMGILPDYKGKIVFWYEDKLHYCFTLDYGGSFVEASDSGHWYNLDYLGREEKSEAERQADLQDE